MDQARCGACRVSHTLFPGMPGGFDPARCGIILPSRYPPCCLPPVRSASGPRNALISGLSTRPARSPINAPRTLFAQLAHHSRPGWLVRPSRLETCTSASRAGLSRHTPTSGGRPPPPLPEVGYVLPEPRPVVLPSNLRASALIHKSSTINHITDTMGGSGWRAALWHGGCLISRAQAGGLGRAERRAAAS
jgi:hypothetical protein